MKKKCTNSKCRKSFTVTASTVSCPYCGESYPRLHNRVSKKVTDADIQRLKNKRIQEVIEMRNILQSSSVNKEKKKGVYLINAGENRVKTILAVKRWAGKGLKEAKELVDAAPFLIEKSEISYNYLGLDVDEYQRECIMKNKSAFEGFTEELNKIGCLYRIIQ